MTYEDLEASLRSTAPPPHLSDVLRALWYDRRGDWPRAHQIAQAVNDANGAWVHAYLHRKEGDIANADYWYHHAGKTRPEISLDAEWEHLVRTFLANPA